MLLTPFILLVPLVILAWYSRRLAVLALLVALPTYLWRTSIISLPTTWLELAIYLVAAMAVWRDGWRNTVGWLAHYTGFWLPVVGWVAAAALSLWWAVDTRVALGIFKGWIIDPLIVVFIVGALANRESNRLLLWRDVIAALLVSATLTTVAAMVMGWQDNVDRLVGWYDSPNVLAMYLVPIAVAAAVWLLVGGETAVKAKWRVIWLAGLALVVLGIIFTNSYAAVVALLGALAVAAAIRYLPWPRLVLVLGGCLVAVSSLLPWLSVSLGRFPLLTHTNATYGVSSGEVRLVLWQQATELVKSHAVLGVGLGSWQPMFRDLATKAGLLSLRQPGLAIELHFASLFPHNLWLTTWLNLGLIGVGLLAWLVLGVFKLVRQSRSWHGAVPAAMIAAILIHGMVDTPLFKNDLMVLWWLPVLMAFSWQAKPKAVSL